MAKTDEEDLEVTRRHLEEMQSLTEGFDKVWRATKREMDTLRQENAALRAENTDLKEQLSRFRP